MSGGLAHATVLLNEAVDALEVRANGIYVDCTFGRGGHSRLILERLGGEGRLIALDKDPTRRGPPPGGSGPDPAPGGKYRSRRA